MLNQLARALKTLAKSATVSMAGKVDLAISDDDVIRLFHGQGGGQFVTAGEHPMGIPGARDLHSADFNNDGVRDILATST